MQVMANKLKANDVMVSPMKGEVVERVMDRVGSFDTAKIVVIFKHTNRPLIIHPNQRVEVSRA